MNGTLTIAAYGAGVSTLVAAGQIFTELPSVKVEARHDALSLALMGDVVWHVEHGRLTEEEAAELLRHDAHGIGGPSGERLHEIAAAIRARSAASRGRPTIAKAT